MIQDALFSEWNSRKYENAPLLPFSVKSVNRQKKISIKISFESNKMYVKTVGSVCKILKVRTLQRRSSQDIPSLFFPGLPMQSFSCGCDIRHNLWASFGRSSDVSSPGVLEIVS